MFRIDRKLISYVGKIENPIAQTAKNKPGTAAEEVPEEQLRQEQLERVNQECEEILAEARRQAEEMHLKASAKASALENEAIEKADQIIAEATDESNHIREQAMREGYNQGLSEGREQAQIEADEQKRKDRAEVKKTLDLIQTDRADILGSLEGEVIALVLEAVEKIVRIKVSEDDTAIRAMIHDAIRRLADPQKVTVRLSTEDYERFFNQGAASFKVGNETVSAAVIADPGFQSGDCIVETEGEAVNIGIDLQLESVARSFKEAGRIA